MAKVILPKAVLAVPNQRTMACKNNTGATTAIGDWGCFDATNTDEDTFSVKKPATAILTQVIGVWLEAVPDSAIGLMQIAGYIGQAKVLGHADMVVGSKLTLVDAQVYAALALGDSLQTLVALEAYTTAAVALKKVFLRNEVF